MASIRCCERDTTRFASCPMLCSNGSLPQEVGQRETRIAARTPRAWQAAYNLTPEAISPPAQVVLPPSVPAAPHLRDCSARTAAREAAESRGRGGEEPQWARGGECCECGPQPPWVTGSDAANLALTRVAQRDLWRSQFPTTCEGRRLLVVEWACPYHGTGSMVHVLSAHMSMALRSSNRTLVFGTSPFTAVIKRRARFLCCSSGLLFLSCLLAWFHVYRAQVMRFLFHWPSQHLCLFINRARHDAYGLSVAQQVAAAAAQQSTILLASSPASGGSVGAAAGMAAGEGVSEGERQYLASVGAEAAGGGALAQECWPMAGFAPCTKCGSASPASSNSTCNGTSSSSSSSSSSSGGGDGSGSGSTGDTGGDEWGAKLHSAVHGEPFIPRPYLSAHVRLSDKDSEMALRFFPSFLFFAYKIRAHVPNLHHVWLSSEMQFVIDEASQYPDWTFLFTNSSRADYLVGAHASNWNQLINELRQTGGRLHAGYLALNDAL
ncbi:unnamed protein product [Closterium sp. NIES-53]